MSYVHRTTSSFWECYAKLPGYLHDRAGKQFDLLGENPGHPSLQLKPVGKFWSARVTEAYRALAMRDGNIFTWFWIGTHDEYERILSG